MSASANPFGLRPAFSKGGVVRPEGIPGGIASGYATALYTGTPVVIGTNGTVEISTGAAFDGVFAGCEYTDAAGNRRVSSWWSASTVATQIVAYIQAASSDVVFEAQADDTLAQAAVGDLVDLVPGTGVASSGLSNASVDASTAGSGTAARIVGFRIDPLNSVGDAFPIVRIVNASASKLG